MTRVRVALGVVGSAFAVYGFWLVYSRQTPMQWLGIIRWAVAGVIIHDGILAPIALLAGVGISRLPARVRTAVAIAAVLIATVTVSGFAVLTRSHAGGLNKTLLDRNYPAGWLMLVVIVMVVVVMGTVAGSLIRRRGKV
ncbi:hypothetical protein [Rudaeicoccus suwonensis]|uniref:Uncharacterized protein n=1 Tax=Rudaeicoccus suwonensis TaxID=657409 RepID=A0A561E9G8_9MICO|nr:hypothetical protein [Rudaeicoccus suwonensis]TWE12264.1 hypothetical protein BKA23_1064 [Rudaeicoccus suwonensis]